MELKFVANQLKILYQGTNHDSMRKAEDFFLAHNNDPHLTLILVNFVHDNEFPYCEIAATILARLGYELTDDMFSSFFPVMNKRKYITILLACHTTPNRLPIILKNPPEYLIEFLYINLCDSKYHHDHRYIFDYIQNALYSLDLPPISKTKLTQLYVAYFYIVYPVILPLFNEEEFPPLSFVFQPLTPDNIEVIYNLLPIAHKICPEKCVEQLFIFFNQLKDIRHLGLQSEICSILCQHDIELTADQIDTVINMCVLTDQEYEEIYQRPDLLFLDEADFLYDDRPSGEVNRRFPLWDFLNIQDTSLVIDRCIAAASVGSCELQEAAFFILSKIDLDGIDFVLTQYIPTSPICIGRYIVVASRIGQISQQDLNYNLNAGHHPLISYFALIAIHNSNFPDLSFTAVEDIYKYISNTETDPQTLFILLDWTKDFVESNPAVFAIDPFFEITSQMLIEHSSYADVAKKLCQCLGIVMIQNSDFATKCFEILFSAFDNTSPDIYFIGFTLMDYALKIEDSSLDLLSLYNLLLEHLEKTDVSDFPIVIKLLTKFAWCNVIEIPALNWMVAILSNIESVPDDVFFQSFSLLYSLYNRIETADQMLSLVNSLGSRVLHSLKDDDDYVDSNGTCNVVFTFLMSFAVLHLEDAGPALNLFMSSKDTAELYRLCFDWISQHWNMVEWIDLKIILTSWYQVPDQNQIMFHGQLCSPKILVYHFIVRFIDSFQNLKLRDDIDDFEILKYHKSVCFMKNDPWGKSDAILPMPFTLWLYYLCPNPDDIPEPFYSKIRDRLTLTPQK